MLVLQGGQWNLAVRRAGREVQGRGGAYLFASFRITMCLFVVGMLKCTVV